jgi:hypothetical protein
MRRRRPGRWPEWVLTAALAFASVACGASAATPGEPTANATIWSFFNGLQPRTKS